MKYTLLAVLLLTGTLSTGQDLKKSAWHITADNIDPTEYYGVTVANGPAMGFCVLATLYAQLGDADKAYEVFTKSYRPNAVPSFDVLSETAGGTNPYFATGSGGMLQTVLFGFGGLEITGEGIRETEKRLPKVWKGLEIKGWKKR